MRYRAIRATLTVGCLGLTSLRAANAQGLGAAVLRVHVTDSAGSPLRGADLSVSGMGAQMVLAGRTNAEGQFGFRFVPNAAQYRLAVRKVGYEQTGRILHIAQGDSLTLEVVLAFLPPALDTVRAEATRLALAKQPYLDAEEIDRDTRALFTLGDVLHKLRPDINYKNYMGVRCPSSPLQGGTRRSGPVHVQRPDKPRVYANGEWVFEMPTFDPLKEIRADHILELHFVTCFDESIPGLEPKPWPSIYITLKTGVAWDLKRGSYVADTAAFTAAERERLGNTRPPD